MNWQSASDFFAMGGYALYVWGSFGACLAALVLEPLLVGRRQDAIVQTLRRQARADRLDRDQP